MFLVPLRKGDSAFSIPSSHQENRPFSDHWSSRCVSGHSHLPHCLQTQPIYLAKLIFQMPQNKTTKFMESVIFSLYNYASNRREAYLLLQLFRTALQEEIK